MAQEFTGLKKAFDAFSLSINEGRYYDAHEDLEPLWYPRRFEEDDEVRLWKGFINAAVSFELFKRGRTKPSETAWATYIKYRGLLEGVDNDRYPIYVKITHLLEQKRSNLYKGL